MQPVKTLILSSSIAIIAFTALFFTAENFAAELVAFTGIVATFVFTEYLIPYLSLAGFMDTLIEEVVAQAKQDENQNQE